MARVLVHSDANKTAEHIATVESGGVSFQNADVGGVGSIAGLALEQSNVDMSTLRSSSRK
jgi:flagellar hook protein FlgE